MEMSPILDPLGRPVWVAGGSKAYKQYEHKGYVVSLEWTGNHRRQNACMVIWPGKIGKVLNGSSSVGHWVIGRRAIVEFVGFDSYNKCTGSASEHCFRECFEAMQVMGKDKSDRQAFLNLVDTIIKYAPELVTMPAVPKEVKKQLAGPPVWDVTTTVKGTGKVIKEATV
jgi:hypothetical protein